LSFAAFQRRFNKRGWVLKTDDSNYLKWRELLSSEKWAVPGLPIIALTAGILELGKRKGV
jgi:hypothetical protein